MPQFDKFSFLSQLCWVFLSFGLLYFFLNYYLLPAISTILKVRKSKLLPILLITEQKNVVAPFGSVFVSAIHQIFILQARFFCLEASSFFDSFKIVLAHVCSSSWLQKALSRFNASFFQTALNVIAAQRTKPKK